MSKERIKPMTVLHRAVITYGDPTASGVSILSITLNNSYSLFSDTSIIIPHMSSIAALAKAFSKRCLQRNFFLLNLSKSYILSVKDCRF